MITSDPENPAGEIMSTLLSLLDRPTREWTLEEGKNLGEALLEAGFSYTLLPGKDIDEEHCEVRYMLKDAEQQIISKEEAKQVLRVYFSYKYADSETISRVSLLPCREQPEFVPAGAAPGTALPATSPAYGELEKVVMPSPPRTPPAPFVSLPDLISEEETQRLHFSSWGKYLPLLGAGILALSLTMSSDSSDSEKAGTARSPPAQYQNTAAVYRHDRNLEKVTPAFSGPPALPARTKTLPNVLARLEPRTSAEENNRRAISPSPPSAPSDPYLVRYGDRLYALFRRWGIRRWQEWERCGDWVEDQGIVKDRDRIYPGDSIPSRSALVREGPQYLRR